MTSKHDLGISYFLGLGLGLIVSLLVYLAFLDRSVDVVAVGTLTAVGFAGSLLCVGYWLAQSELDGSSIWRIAQWCALGIGLATVVTTGLMLTGSRPAIVIQFPHLLVNLIAGSAVVGTFLGLIHELRTQYDRVEELNRRNMVLNQVMQHDIRNDVNVIEARSTLLANRYEEVDPEDIAPLQRKSEDIIETSQLARHVQQLHEDTDGGPINVVALVSSCVSSMRSTYPDATIAVSQPDEAWVATDELFQTVIKNLVENAIEHNDHSPDITVGVEVPDDDSIVIQIADNGPGMPAEYREMLQADTTPDSPRSASLGLWIVKWFVDQYEGTLDIATNDPRGTTVTLELPAATQATIPEPPRA